VATGVRTRGQQERRPGLENKNLLPIQRKVFAVKGWIHNLSNTEQISDLLGIIDEVSLPELSESMKNLCHVYVQQVLAVR
jgi:hypothetical protein